MTKVPFAVLANLFDQIEQAAGERPGGSTDAERALEERAEAVILQTRADTPADLAWKRQRLARALANGWDAEPTLKLVQSILEDVAGRPALLST